MPRPARCSIDYCNNPAHGSTVCLRHLRASLADPEPRSVADDLDGLPLTKLYEIAKAVDLDGRSTMDHDELVAALVDHGASAD